MTTVRPTNSPRVLVAYYAATALFVLLDYGFNFNVRLTFLESYPDWRSTYYGICFICLALMLWRPALALVVGVIESLMTMVALILHMWLRVMRMTHGMVETSADFVTTPEIINFLISGSIAYFAWSQGMKVLQGR